jgi:predicted nucleic acid-binding protein
VIVVDASAALAGLLNAGPARAALGFEQVHVPHLVDSEVASGLRRRVASGRMGSDTAWRRLAAWRRLGMTRYPTFPLLDRIRELRDNLSADDAAYVALAEALDCGLLTADGRLARAPHVGCSITVVPRSG